MVTRHLMSVISTNRTKLLLGRGEVTETPQTHMVRKSQIRSQIPEPKHFWHMVLKRLEQLADFFPPDIRIGGNT